MSVEITADLPEVQHTVDDEVAQTVAAAEAVLTRRFGATVRLTDPEDLGGSERSIVLRLRVAETPFSIPRTLVVKRYRRPATPDQPDPFAHEAVSSQLFTALTTSERVSPEIIAHSAADRLLVLEDLGRAPTLADKLLGDDARAAERALLGWARSLGRLHSTTAGREADFDALMRRTGVRSWRDPMAPQARTVLAELPTLLQHALGVAGQPAAEKYARGTTRLLGSTKYRAFSPSDICLHNNLVTSRGVRFLDFEGGCIRDVTLDAAYTRALFPTCWCTFALPNGMAEAMLAAWRSEVGTVWPDLDDDYVLMPRLLDAQLLWVWLSTWWLLPSVAASDCPIDLKSVASRRSASLVARWRQLATDAASCDREAVADHARAVVAALLARFGDEAAEMPLYPAFRSRTPIVR